MTAVTFAPYQEHALIDRHLASRRGCVGQSHIGPAPVVRQPAGRRLLGRGVGPPRERRLRVLSRRRRQYRSNGAQIAWNGTNHLVVAYWSDDFVVSNSFAWPIWADG